DSPYLGNRPDLYLHVDVVLREPVLRDVGREAPHITLHPRQRRRRRLLHDVAELAGYLQSPLDRICGRLDEEDVAADRRPGEPGRDTGVVGAPAGLGEEAALAEHLAHVLRPDRLLPVARPLGVLARHLAADRTDLALQAAHAGLARVALDDQPQRLLGYLDLAAGEPVPLDLAGHQVPLGDLQLLLLGVAGHRVGGARVADRADDRARDGADVGPAVAADLRLVAHAAD